MIPTRATVDLGAIRHNLKQFQMVAHDKEIIAVVKANAYGHGLVPVAQTLRAGGAHWLAVATVEDGIELRACGDEGPLLVVGPLDPVEAVALVENNLTPQVGSLRMAEALARAAASAGVVQDFHLKIDTGLHRLGLLPSLLAEFLEACTRWPQLRLSGVYTHFSRADDGDFDFTHRQLEELLSVAVQIDGPVLRHAAGSSASMLWDESHLDAIRPGIALYGYPPAAAQYKNLDLRRAMQLHTTIAELHPVPEGATAGYGEKWVAGRPSLVATLPIGVAKGMLRNLVGRSHALVRGYPAPFVDISLDSTLIDVTDVKGVAPGDPVLLWGSQDGGELWAHELAAAAGTIVDEVLCRLDSRIPREYINSR